MPTVRELILVPHTHWDREWYRTFQQFRMLLVRAVDKVLSVLDCDPAFSYFMLDGQTVVLEDYLEVRPEHAERLRAYAQAGRLLIGPWYLQPDEFLVGGEALIRNLLLGAGVGAAYGGVMKVGYVPDTFGHIAQLPQILQGFGIDNAIFWRGVGAKARQSEFWWAAPDGTRVLVLHLADPIGYSNARDLPLHVDDFLTRLRLIQDALLPKSTTGILLLMNGSDHLEPQEGLPAVIAEANARLNGAQITIGTLPQYVAAIRDANPTLESFSGEWRSSQISPLLPGVLSTRIWIKQRNAACEYLLTDVAEPLRAWTWALGEPYPAGFLRVAWRHLLHNQPHDSICGCSIDQVHAEMVSRFDQSQQIAEGLHRFEDGGDVGDLYNYCPPLAEDALVTAPTRPPEITLLEQGPVRATLRVALDYRLPARCSNDRTRRSDETAACAIITDVSLSPGVRRIDIQTRVENAAQDHRLRVLFPLPFAADHAEVEGTFEVRQRPAQASPPDGDPANWQSWIERPVNTQPQKRFVDVSDGRLGLALLNKGLPEYELIPAADGQSAAVALTLLRCIGWLSRGDLSTRRGHAGPMEATPQAQLPGTWTFEYALIPHAGDWRADDAEVQRQAQAFQSPLRAVVAKTHVGVLALEESLVSHHPDTLVVSAIKRAEREEALLVRCYNPMGTEQTATLTLGLEYRDVRLARLDEEPLDAEQQQRLKRLSENSLRIRLRAGEIVTLLFFVIPITDASL